MLFVLFCFVQSVLEGIGFGQPAILYISGSNCAALRIAATLHGPNKRSHLYHSTLFFLTKKKFASFLRIESVDQKKRKKFNINSKFQKKKSVETFSQSAIVTLSVVSSNINKTKWLYSSF